MKLRRIECDAPHSLSPSDRAVQQDAGIRSAGADSSGVDPADFRLNRDVAEQLDVPGPYLAKVLFGNETVADMAATARKGRSRFAPRRKAAIKR